MNLRKMVGSLLSLWFVSVFVVLAVFFLAVVLYKATFSGGFSNVSADWSNFGSYIGGILSPMVSFVTLLAVLRTVYLQRDLLDSQRDEFNRMNELQQRTFDSQQAQIQRAGEEALALQVAAAQDSAIKAIEMRMNMHERDFDRQHDMAFRYSDKVSGDMTPENESKIKLIVSYRDRARESVDLLSKVALDISIARYENIDQVKRFLEDGLKEAYAKLDDAYPETVKGRFLN